MYPYFLTYSLISVLTLMEFYKNRFYLNHNNKIKFFMLVYLCFFMGLKYHIGGDWGTYYNYFNDILSYKLKIADLNNDLGFYLLNLYIKKLGFNFMFINLISSIVPLLGMHLLAKHFKKYWLFFLVLMPYFIFIVLMGYTRQSISIGFFFIALSFIYKKNNSKNIFLFTLFILIACFFHKSSFIFFIIPFLIIRLNFFSLSILIHLSFIILLILVYIILNDRFLDRLEYFISHQYSSFGGYLRTGILFIICLFNIIFLNISEDNIYFRKLNNQLNFITLSICLMIFLIPSTVIIDRFLLFFYFLMPLLVITLFNISKNDLNRKIIVYSMIIFGFIFMILWFNFATNSFSWLPYRNYLFL